MKMLIAGETVTPYNRTETEKTSNVWIK